MIGVGESGEDGRYEIHLDRPVGAPPLNLRLRAEPRDGEPIVSAMNFDVDLELEVDLSRAADGAPERSTYEKLLDRVRPALGDIGIGDLRETGGRQEISFVAGDRNVTPDDLALAGMAERFAARSKLAPDVFFAFLRQAQPPSLPSRPVDAEADPAQLEALEDRVFGDIVGMEEGAQRRVLDAAIRTGLVPLAMGAEIEPAIERMKSLRAETLADAPFGLGKVTFGEVLATTGLDGNQRRRVLGHLMASERGEGPLWERIE